MIMRIVGGEMADVLDADILIIGREGDIKLPDSEETVGRKHCELTIADNGYFIRDLNSANGTFVEEDGTLKQVDQAWVELDQVIAFGETKVTLAELLETGAYQPGNKKAAEKNQDLPVAEIPGKRIRCPNAHVTLAILKECHRCHIKLPHNNF